MFESQLRINNFYWSGDSFRPPVESDGEGKALEVPGTLRGQYAFAVEGRGHRVTLVRDPLGCNKLFFAIHGSGKIQVSNYIVDLVRRGVPFPAIFSVPAGHLVTIDPAEQVLVTRPCFQAVIGSASVKGSYRSVARVIRQHLELWFARFARAFPDRRIFLCLSGGHSDS
ncbi:MAG: hypothetical protein HYV04_08170 [Deltaproteobacteria bacterium]|nr:hypothetical protein [Deltaproteobacteria bacterium]